MTTRRLTAVLAAAALALLVAVAPAGAALRLTEATARFPDRAFLLTLPKQASITADQVRMREDGQRVAGLSVLASNAVGQRQFGTVLVIDASSSMHGDAIAGAMRAARSFARRRNPAQPLGVVVFNNRPRVLLPLTTDGGAIRDALASPPKLARETLVYDATQAALDMLRRARIGAGSVIVLSDGADTGSRASESSVVRSAGNVHARIYAVGLRTRAFDSSALTSLAASTEGVYTEASSTSRLRTIYADLGEELSNQYVLRYRSTAALGQRVRVAVRVAGQPGVASTTYKTRALNLSTGTVRDIDTPFVETTLGALLISLAVAALLGLALYVLTAPRRSVRARVEQFVSPPPPREDDKAWSGALLERVFGAEGEQRGIERVRGWSRFESEVRLSAISMTPEAVAMWTALATVVFGWLLVAATDSAIAGVLALLLPFGVWLAIRVQVDRQRRAFDEQLPDNLQVIASAMRAGHTFVGAMAVVVDDAPEPSRREFRRIIADEQLGVPLPDALKRVSDRMQSEDFDRVALVTTLQRETGGNTAEVMDRLTETIRERMDLRRTIRTLTAQGRLTRWIVSALPPAMLVFISLVNPDYIRPLFHTAIGVFALVLGSMMLIAGSLIIKRIVEFEE